MGIAKRIPRIKAIPRRDLFARLDCREPPIPPAGTEQPAKEGVALNDGKMFGKNGLGSSA